MDVKITRVTTPLVLGEGPHWDERTKSLYFVDIDESTIHKYTPETDVHTYAKVGDKEVSIIIPVENEVNKYLITYGCSLATVMWDGVSETVSDLCIVQTLDRYPQIRINDGKTSPSGVLFAEDNNAKTLLDGISISNGLAWSLDEKEFYYIDSLTSEVAAFDYDKKNITISNRRTIFDLKKNNIEGLPDGMTIDTDGNLWIACYLGGQVLKVDPKTGTLLNSIKFNAPCITSVAFGGTNMEDLYVTSAHNILSEEEFKAKPDSGCLFKITGTGSKGIAGEVVNEILHIKTTTLSSGSSASSDLSVPAAIGRTCYLCKQENRKRYKTANCNMYDKAYCKEYEGKRFIIRASQK
ncbi:hypothetical protein PGB90_001741 [Kerria lacca]